VKTEFRTSFKKDLKQIKHSELHKGIIDVIEKIEEYRTSGRNIVDPKFEEAPKAVKITSAPGWEIIILT